MKNAKSATVVIPVLATLALIYSNIYAPQNANVLFFLTIVLWIGWWLLNFQFATGNRPGLLTSKTEKALSKAHAEKLQADASVLHSEADIHRGHAAIATGKLTHAKAEFELKEADGNFTRGQLLAEALHNNAMLIASKATEMGVPVDSFTGYLMKTLEEKVKYETAVLISGAELQKERQSLEQTIRFTLTESSLKFEDRLALIDQISEVKKRIDEATDKTKKELLQEEMNTLKARLDAARQTDLPKADGATA
jgi:hypothetical protein